MKEELFIWSVAGWAGFLVLAYAYEFAPLI